MDPDQPMTKVAARSPSDVPPDDRIVPGWVRPGGAWSGNYVTPPPPDPPLSPAPVNRPGCLPALPKVMKKLPLPLLTLMMIAGTALLWEYIARENKEDAIIIQALRKVEQWFAVTSAIDKGSASTTDAPEPACQEVNGGETRKTDALETAFAEANGTYFTSDDEGDDTARPVDTDVSKTTPGRTPKPFAFDTGIRNVYVGEKDGVPIHQRQKVVVVTIPPTLRITVREGRIVAGEEAYTKQMAVTKQTIRRKYSNLPIKVNYQHPWKYKHWLDVD